MAVGYKCLWQCDWDAHGVRIGIPMVAGLGYPWWQDGGACDRVMSMASGPWTMRWRWQTAAQQNPAISSGSKGKQSHTQGRRILSLISVRSGWMKRSQALILCLSCTESLRRQRNCWG